MNRLASLSLGVLAVCAGICLPYAATAATKTAAMTVSAEVVDSCNIDASGMGGIGAARCARMTPYQVVTSSELADATPTSYANDDGTSSSSEDATPRNTRIVTYIF